MTSSPPSGTPPAEPSLRLDLRGTPCPLNFIRSRLALERIAAGEWLQLELDAGEPELMVAEGLRQEGHRVERGDRGQSLNPTKLLARRGSACGSAAMGTEAEARADGGKAMVKGLVTAIQANFCQVSLEIPGPSGLDQLLCTRRSRLGQAGERIHVGDRVGLEGIDWPAGRAAVGDLLPRTSLLGRPPVANCDRIVVVIAMADPVPDPEQLSRFLLTAEHSGQPVQVVFSKAGSGPARSARALAATTEELGL